MMTPAKHRRSTGQQHYHLRLGLVVLGLAPNPAAAPQSVKSPGEAIAQWSTNYDKYLRPNLFMGNTDPDEIRMGFYTVRVWDVLPVAESFSVEAYLFCLATVSKFAVVRYFPFDTRHTPTAAQAYGLEQVPAIVVERSATGLQYHCGVRGQLRRRRMG